MAIDPGVLHTEASHTDLARSTAALCVPELAWDCSGVLLDGRMVRTFVFSTDVAVICNCNADAVLAVYPFIGQPVVSKALLAATERPIITGIGGALTHPDHSLKLAQYVQGIGISGVVVNMTFPAEAITCIVDQIDIPLILSLCELTDDTRRRIESGAAIVNVAAGRNTANVVAEVRDAYPHLPIMASGGHTEKTIRATLDAGASAISWTPPDIQQLEHDLMMRARAAVATQD